MEPTVLENVREEHAILLNEMRLVPISSGELRKSLFENVKNTLVRHMEAEEETIYSRLKSDMNKVSIETLNLKNTREHHHLREYLQRLTLMNMNDKAWTEMFEEFAHVARGHCFEEEKSLFDELKEDFSREELIEMGTDFMSVRVHDAIDPDQSSTFA